MGILSQDKVIVGIELNNDYAQISFCLSENKAVETFSQVAGEEDYNIPMALCKRIGVNQWFCGREALRYNESGQGVLVDSLLELALEGEPVLVDNESFDPTALLALYIKRCLGMLSPIASPDKITAVMFTCEVIDHRMLEVLHLVVERLRLKTDKIGYQSHTESYYSYVIQQPTELWMNQSVLFSYSGNSIITYRMESNRHTTPVVAFIEERSFPFRDWEEPDREDVFYDKDNRDRDCAFLEIATQICEDRQIGSVFLIGEGFSQSWMKESLRYLCQNRRVFLGNNLFSKGACLSMKERLFPDDNRKQYVFLGNDKLKANVGLKLFQQNEETYCALLDAGINWYDAEAELEFYMRDGNEITLTITPLISKAGKIAQITLEDFKESISRLRMRMFMESENDLVVEIEDLGLGEIRTSSGHIWKEKIRLY